MFAMGMVTFFCLCANVLATVAWFTANRSADNDNDYFGVQNEGDAEIEAINLYKFKYNEITYGSDENVVTIIDYLAPEDGEVKKYAFNTTEQKFGENVNDVFEAVTIMNVYDPLEKVIKQSSFSLLELNCNAIYEIILSSSTFTTASVTISANWLSSKTKTSSQIFLTDCLDFDVYFESDLLESNPSFSTTDPETGDPINKLYYPSYIGKSTSLTANEEVYYKLSYLSSLENSHSHFYGSNPKPNSISLIGNTPRNVTFDASGKLKIYVNVNYAPSELEKYQKAIYDGDIEAIYDYALSFQVGEAVE